MRAHQKFLFKTRIVIPKEGPQFELTIDSLVEENARVNFHIEHGDEYFLRSEDFFIIAWGYDEGELNFSFTDTSGNYSTRTLTGELRFSFDFPQYTIKTNTNKTYNIKVTINWYDPMSQIYIVYSWWPVNKKKYSKWLKKNNCKSRKHQMILTELNG